MELGLGGVVLLDLLVVLPVGRRGRGVDQDDTGGVGRVLGGPHHGDGAPQRVADHHQRARQREGVDDAVKVRGQLLQRLHGRRWPTVANAETVIGADPGLGADLGVDPVPRGLRCVSRPRPG